jgi:tetratricopeptide (TPR) repeat protein
MNARGTALERLRRYDEALACYDQSLSIQPRNLGALNNRGNAQKALKQYEDALQSYNAALKIRPDFLEAIVNRGNALKDLRRYAEALASCDEALSLCPDDDDAFVGAATAALYHCDWLRTATIAGQFWPRIHKGKATPTPYTSLGYCDEPGLLLPAIFRGDHACAVRASVEGRKVDKR